jgi:phosphate transport system substrate-binding protein
MTQFLITVSVAFVCAAGTGCSAPRVSETRNQVVDKVDTTCPDSESDADATRFSSDALPSYEPVAGLSGEINCIGAPTTTNLVARVATQFRQMYPNVTLPISSGLTDIGPSALLEGRADLVPMSRALTPEEIKDFAGKYGYAPTEIKVAADALAIFVEKRNPVPGLTLKQLDEIFSRTQRRGGSPIHTWGEAGLTGEWADRPIVLYGYAPEDAAHQIFQQQVLEGGSFQLSMRAQRGGSSIVQGVAAVPGSIGFASIFFACKRVRTVPLAGADGRLYAPTAENVNNHRYPLSRFLYICVNKPPRQPLGGPAAEFLRFLLSREGQQIVTEGGNFPLDAATLEQGRRGLTE